MDTYSHRFTAWLTKRKPEVRARILRLNPLPIDEGRWLRGYHPHRRSTNIMTGNISKGVFIKTHGREAWAALPPCCIDHDGHRKSISHESEIDQLWMVPPDHPVRHARRVNGQWVISQTQARERA